MLIADIRIGNKKSNLQRVNELCMDLGISHPLKHYPKNLPGGENRE
jgi:ABC-type molybdate transport system ATPase subunit